MTSSLKAFLLGTGISVLVLVSFFGGALADRVFVVKPLDMVAKRFSLGAPASGSLATQLPEVVGDSSVADVAESSSRSVVTVSVKRQQRVVDPSQFGPFGFFMPSPESGRVEEVQQDIGTGFVVDAQGLIVTNKHVVDDLGAEYLVIDKDNNEHKVINIYRDPTNDLAIVKVENSNLPALPLGESDKIRVGQSVIAIGTALGEFRHTVTTGVVSGLGRGIEAGSYLGGQVESLENVIQTDAAINPGNSGGPLIDVAGNVIGVNVAVSAGAQNIGFALPINIVKSSLENFNQTGQFNRPFMGIRYQVISAQAALANEVPQGIYVVEVVEGASAAEAGLQTGDIITEFDGQKTKDTELSTLINGKKVGDQVTIKYWRDGSEKTLQVTLKGSST